MTIPGLIDRIYEAAFVPEGWPDVLHHLSTLSGSASAALLIYGEARPPRWRSTELTRQSIHEFCASGEWARCERSAYFFANLPAGFVSAADCFTSERLDRDPVTRRLRALGLEAQLAAMTPLAGGEFGVVTFERRNHDGRHDPGAVALLDGFSPHLRRAIRLAARLGLEPARTAVATLQAIGLPAAVLTRSGRVVAVNDLLEGLSPILLPAAYGFLRIAEPAAQASFRQALLETGLHAAPRSIPVQVGGDHGACVVHLLPFRGAALDIFAGADVLLVAAPAGIPARSPGDPVLQGLFDLSPAECRLAGALASGRSLKEAAARQNIRVSTARSYLKSIFGKTETHQQSELVALVRSLALPGS